MRNFAGRCRKSARQSVRSEGNARVLFMFLLAPLQLMKGERLGRMGWFVTRRQLVMARFVDRWGQFTRLKKR